MQYINQGPLFLSVQMHQPDRTTHAYMDALQAFWPGLQVSSYHLTLLLVCYSYLFLGTLLLSHCLLTYLDRPVNFVLSLFVLQVLKGDLKKAIEMHQMLYEVSKKHTFLPEVASFSPDITRDNNCFDNYYQSPSHNKACTGPNIAIAFICTHFKMMILKKRLLSAVLYLVNTLLLHIFD